MLQHSNLFTMRVPDDGYSAGAWGALDQIFTLLLLQSFISKYILKRRQSSCQINNNINCTGTFLGWQDFLILTVNITRNQWPWPYIVLIIADLHTVIGQRPYCIMCYYSYSLQRVLIYYTAVAGIRHMFYIVQRQLCIRFITNIACDTTRS